MTISPCWLLLLGACAATTDPLAGDWTYALPDRTTGDGIATVTCPAPAPSFAVPQIGTLHLAADGHATTDQGCAWDFALDGTTAHLAGQTCFNQVIGSSYTLDWTLAADGAESIRGTSHLPAGDCAFALDAHRVRPGAPAAFAGTWRYVDAIQQIACSAAPMFVPRTGSLAITADRDRLTATDDDGCTTRYRVTGNTAELDPPDQPCWAFRTLATDGVELYEFSRRTTADGCAALLAGGRLAHR